MTANLEDAAVATGLEKVSFHSNTKEGQCQRMFRLPQSYAHFMLVRLCRKSFKLGFSSIPRTSRYTSWIQKRQRNLQSYSQSILSLLYDEEVFFLNQRSIPFTYENVYPFSSSLSVYLLMYTYTASCLGYYKQCCFEHRGACTFFNQGFRLSWIHTQEWNCWIIWQFYSQFFEGSSY